MAMEAKSKEQALQIIKANKPRDYCLHGEQIIKNLALHFFTPPKPFEPYPQNSFKVKPILWDWVEKNIGLKYGAPGQPTSAPALNKKRYLLLVLIGPTKLGKTEWARSIGRHIYWKGMCKLDDLERTDYDYIVIDDVDWEFVPNSIKKSVLLGTGDCIVTDKYVKKLAVTANKPVIYIMNPPDAYDQQGGFYNSPYWQDNTFVYEVVSRMWRPAPIASVQSTIADEEMKHEDGSICIGAPPRPHGLKRSMASANINHPVEKVTIEATGRYQEPHWLAHVRTHGADAEPLPPIPELNSIFEEPIDLSGDADNETSDLECKSPAF